MNETVTARNKYGRTTSLTLRVLYTLSISTLLFSLFCYYQLNITGVVFISLFVFTVFNGCNILVFYIHKNILPTYVISSILGYVTLCCICCFSDGINSPAMSFFVLLIFFGYLINKIHGNIWLSVILLTVFVFYLLKVFDIQMSNEISSVNVAEFNLLFLLFLIIVLGGVFGKMMNANNYKIKQAKLEIVQRDAEKSVMLKEIHHRVKNNLQVVNSLLRIQSRQMADNKVKEVFKSAQNRVITMARLHENIYQTQDLKHIDIAKYLNVLITDLIKSYTVDKCITLHLNISPIPMSIDTLLPISLIINEMVTNSLKHAFVNANEGEISVELMQHENNQCKLVVYDNGETLYKDILSTELNSTGVTLIKTLIRQLNGTITKMKLQKGTGFEMYFTNTI
ncbi:MAG: histidine kinase dimerization/phosphoacceptor domain -containing protein [Flavobacteriaceae bacterium]